jgi:hypothetical protein
LAHRDVEDFETTNGGFVPSPSMNGWQWGVSSNVSDIVGQKYGNPVE